MIPDDTRRFILTSIASVPHAEALLLLRAAPRAWLVADVAARLYVSAPNAGRLLADLARSGLLVQEAEAFRYAPGNPALADTVDTFAQLYATQLVAVTNLIHSHTERQAHSFAEAFNFRRKS
ncbi:MAG: helix-turn-helix domain-containing protein [Telluria sp.]